MKRAVVVLGMHRSGTSALARALSFAGFAQPRDLMQPQADNPKGFWEPIGIVRLNEQILKSLQGSWDQPGPWLIPGQTVAEARHSVNVWIAERFHDRALAAIRVSFGEDASIVLKDPRASLFLPFWAEVLRAAGYKPHFVLIHRNPLDVAASLQKRNQIGPRLACQLWAQYNLCSINAGNSIAIRAACSYENLLANPAEVLAGIFKNLKFRTETVPENLTNIIDIDQRHHATAPETVERFPSASRLVRTMYELLRKWDEYSLKSRARIINDLQQQADEATLFVTRPAKVWSEEAMGPIPTTGETRGISQVIGVAGLPRSGTTLVCSILSVHSRIFSLYEPWNATKKAKSIRDNALVNDLLIDSAARPGAKNILLVKETATQLRYLHNLKFLLKDNACPRRDLIIVVRNPLHIFLSEVQARREWWGEQGLTLKKEVFDKWAQRTLDALSVLDTMASELDALLLSYEALAEQPALLLQVMKEINVELEPTQIEYEKHVDLGAVRGDIGLASSPRPISAASLQKREQELQPILPILEGSHFMGGIQDYARRAATLASVGLERRRLFGPIMHQPS